MTTQLKAFGLCLRHSSSSILSPLLHLQDLHNQPPQDPSTLCTISMISLQIMYNHSKKHTQLECFLSKRLCHGTANTTQ